MLGFRLQREIKKAHRLDLRRQMKAPCLLQLAQRAEAPRQDGETALVRSLCELRETSRRLVHHATLRAGPQVSPQGAMLDRPSGSWARQEFNGYNP